MLRDLPNALTLVFSWMSLITLHLKREAMPKKRGPHKRKKETLTFP